MQLTMTVEMDKDVQAVAEFMQRRISAGRLMGVASGLSAIAPILWGLYPQEEVRPIRLSADDPHRQQVATVLPPAAVYVGGDSVEEEVCL